MTEMTDREPDLDGVEAMPRRSWSGAFRSVMLPVGLLAVILGGLWYWDTRDAGTGIDDGGYGTVELPAERNVTGRGPAVEPGRAAPDFLLETPDGGELRLSDLQGQPVVVNFWATWCEPCRAEMPELVAAYERHRDAGLVVVGVNLQEADSQVTAFAEEFGIDFPLVMDRDGELADVWRLGAIDGIPTSYFIDASGVIRAFFFGPMQDDDLEERLAEIMPEDAA